MNDEERALLQDAYGIIASFSEMMADTIIPATGTLYMTSDFQSLESARGMLGELIEKSGGCGTDSLHMRLITSRETRKTLQDAYQAADLLFRNAVPETEWSECCATLMACLFTPLNTSVPRSAMEQALSNIIGMAQLGLQTIESLDAMGPTEGMDWYLDPAGETFEKRRDQVRSALERLVPDGGAAQERSE